MVREDYPDKIAGQMETYEQAGEEYRETMQEESERQFNVEYIDRPKFEEVQGERDLWKERALRRQKEGSLSSIYYNLNQVSWDIADVFNFPPNVDEIEVSDMAVPRLGIRHGCIVEGVVSLNIYWGHGIDATRTDINYIQGAVSISFTDYTDETALLEDDRSTIPFITEVDLDWDDSNRTIGNPARIFMNIDCKDSADVSRWSFDIDSVEWY